MAKRRHSGGHAQLAEVFARLADSLVEEFDVLEMLDELTGYCLELFDISAAGLLLTDGRDRLRAVAASAQQEHMSELFARQIDDGPCLDCYRHGQQVLVPNLDDPTISQQWPHFVDQARHHGIRAVHALPLRLRTQTIGALTLFSSTETVMARADLRVCQALADTATIAILQQRTLADSEQLAGQLQHALTSRLTLERAIGTLAERHGITATEAFTQLRAYARNHNLTAVAQTVCSGPPLQGM